jgi:hypothetical protein
MLMLKTTCKDLFQGLFVKGYSTPIEGIRCGLSSLNLFAVLFMNVSILHLSSSRVVAEFILHSKAHPSKQV